MLAHVMKLPANAVHVARRTTTLSMVLLGELVSTAFPSLSMPVDRIALEAYVMGYDAAEVAVPAGARRRTRTS